MKLFKIIFSSITLSVICFLVSSCTKEGLVGPAGSDGNANVKVYFFEHPDSLSNSHPINLQLPGITNNYLDSSLILVYYIDQSNGLWYPSPGLGANNTYQTKWYVYSNSSPEIEMRIANPDGSSYSGAPKLVSKVKIVVAKGSEFLSGKKEPVDYTDYDATMKFFNLKK